VAVDETIQICNDADIVIARQHGRALATKLGFNQVELTMIVTAISELARNIVLYAGRGQITLQVESNHHMTGMVVIASDQGPGIRDVKQAMQDGFSTSGGLGLGLPGIQRLMEEFRIESAVGRGTMITAKRWKRG
jgi:serine/threonine-protein kinase RsbT